MDGHPRTIFPVSKNGILFFNRIELLSQQMNNETTDTLGLIAGNRSLPLLFARQARTMGVKRLVAVAFEGETDPELGKCVDDVIWLKVGRLSQLDRKSTRLNSSH